MQEILSVPNIILFCPNNVRRGEIPYSREAKQKVGQENYTKIETDAGDISVYGISRR